MVEINPYESPNSCASASVDKTRVDGGFARCVALAAKVVGWSMCALGAAGLLDQLFFLFNGTPVPSQAALFGVFWVGFFVGVGCLLMWTSHLINQGQVLFGAVVLVTVLIVCIIIPAWMYA